jgi:hypothetical protein
LPRVTDDDDRHSESQKVTSDLLVDHRGFVDDDEPRVACGAIVIDDEYRIAVFVLLLQPVDEAVDGGGVEAALAAHDVGGLAREGREGHLAVDAGCEVAGERGLAGPGVTVQAEDLFVAGAVPLRDRLESGFLLLGSHPSSSSCLRRSRSPSSRRIVLRR